MYKSRDPPKKRRHCQSPKTASMWSRWSDGSSWSRWSDRSAWSNWTAWSYCSQKCRRDTSATIGTQKRSRLCDTGRCGGRSREVKSCGSFICFWNDWSEWAIPAECKLCNINTNNQSRTRTCYTGDCAGDAIETTKCDNSCDAVF